MLLFYLCVLLGCDLLYSLSYTMNSTYPPPWNPFKAGTTGCLCLLTVFSRKAKHTHTSTNTHERRRRKGEGVCVREIERWVGERERAIRFEIQEAHSGIQRVSRRLPCIICFSCETMRFEPKWRLGSCMQYRSHYVDKAYWTWQVTGWNIEKMKLSLKQYSKIKKN